MYKTIGYLIVQGGDEEHFLNYGYCEEKSKGLYSYHKRRIPNSFGGTMFNRHRLSFESRELRTDFSDLYFFLLSLTDRSEAINKPVGSVNLSKIDIK